MLSVQIMRANSTSNKLVQELGDTITARLKAGLLSNPAHGAFLGERLVTVCAHSSMLAYEHLYACLCASR
jgi:hypothetical protein